MTRLYCSLLLAYCAMLSLGTTEALHQVPLFTAHELLSSTTSSRLEQVLTTTGLLALPLPTTSDRSIALKGLCHCVASPEFRKLEGSDAITLGDGQTTRSTLATATVGNRPLPLPELATICASETAEAMEALRDQVAEASQLFLQALDQLIGGSKSPLLENSYGGSYHSVSSIVQAASNLEHFHVYSKKTDGEVTQTQPALELHTDAGLFLAFVPALDCQQDGSDESFYLKDAQGTLQRAVFPPNSVAIMLGAGAEHWLKTSPSLKLRATRHSVQMEQGVSRAWYGMMHLVPESAIVEESPQRRTFGEMRQAMVLKSETKTTRRFGDDADNAQLQDVSIGCGFSNDVEEPQGDALPARRGRRRLQHVENAGACNNVTNFYCWMSCLDIPSHEQAEGFLNEGYSLYCVDPSIVASTGKVSNAQKPCMEQGVLGLAMNSNCMGMWQPTAPGVVAQEMPIELTLADDFEEPFCYGGTSMYMEGFQWMGTTCPIYLFPSLVLDSAGAMVGACLFTILFGIALEWVIQQRRVTVRQYSPGYKRLAVSATFYGIQLTMGYTIMLIVMIYSIPLFLSVVIGIVGGHVLFSASDAVWKKKLSLAAACNDETHESKTEDKWSDTPDAELEDETNTGVIVPSTSCSRRAKKEFRGAADLEVPEGSTPCCQNAL